MYRSGFIPRILGVLLILGGVPFLVNGITSIALPEYAQVVSSWMKPFGFGEIIFMLWLLIMGAKPRSAPPHLLAT